MEHLLKILAVVFAGVNFATISGVCLLSFYKAKQTKKNISVAVVSLAISLICDGICLFWLKNIGMINTCRVFGLLLVFTAYLLYENTQELYIKCK